MTKHKTGLDCCLLVVHMDTCMSLDCGRKQEVRRTHTTHTLGPHCRRRPQTKSQCDNPTPKPPAMLHQLLTNCASVLLHVPDDPPPPVIPFQSAVKWSRNVSVSIWGWLWLTCSRHCGSVKCSWRVEAAGEAWQWRSILIEDGFCEESLG